MSKVLLWFMLPIVVLGFLALSVLVLIPILLESSILRPKLESWISMGLGRPVLIQGPVRISLLPEIRVSLSGLLVEAPEGFPEKYLARVDWLQAETTLGHIFGKGIRPQSMEMKGLHLVVERNWGKGSLWPGIPGQAKKSDSGVSSRAETTSRSKSQISPFLLLPGVGLKVSQGEILLVDPVDKALGRITGLGLSLGKPSPDGSQHLKVQGSFQGHSFMAEGILKDQGKDSAGKQVLLLELNCRAEGRPIGSIRGQIRSWEKTPEAELLVRMGPFSLQGALRTLGSEPKGYFWEHWGRVSFHGNLVLSPSKLELRQAELRADEHLIRFWMRMGKSDEKGLELNLEVEELDLNHFSVGHGLSSPRKKNPGVPKNHLGQHTKNSTGIGSLDFPVPTMAGSVRIHKVLFKSQPLEELQISYRLRKTVLELEEIRLRLQGGELWGRGSVDLDRAPPYLHLDLNTRGVQVGPVLERLARTVFLEGSMESRWSLEGSWQGDLDRAALAWTAEADILLTQGSIKGVDLAKISRSLGLASKKEEKKEASQARTFFTRLEAHLGLEHGHLKVSKAFMQNKDLRVLAAGQANLLERSLDFRLEPELGSQSEQEQEATLVVPFWVDGSFSHPRFHPDLAGIKKKGQGKLHLSLPSSKELKEVLRNLLKGR